MSAVDFEKIKYKIMSKGELFLALDRLTRFKHPRQKYRRVFSQIIFGKLLEPKLSQKALEFLDSRIISKIVETVWNNSVKALCKEPLECSYKINEIILNEEKKLYIIDKNDEILIKTPLNIANLLDLAQNKESLPLNLRWVLELRDKSADFDFAQLRKQKALKFPIEKILICEGITEEILMPVFADFVGYNFDSFGVHLIAPGGKNQVARLYYELKNLVRAPIFTLLDSDAKETELTIKKVLRKEDKVFLIEKGEFEDIIPKKIIKKTINENYKNENSVTIGELSQELPMCKILSELFKKKGFGDFKKAEFAKKLSQTISKQTAISDEIKEIINSICAL